jgi:hypothetical protein
MLPWHSRRPKVTNFWYIVVTPTILTDNKLVRLKKIQFNFYWNAFCKIFCFIKFIYVSIADIGNIFIIICGQKTTWISFTLWWWRQNSKIWHFNRWPRSHSSWALQKMEPILHCKQLCCQRYTKFFTNDYHHWCHVFKTNE